MRFTDDFRRQHLLLPRNLYEPTGYTYTDPYGRIYDLGADGSLHSITDLNSNVLTFTADGISSSVGDLSVQFIRDGEGRIAQIIDPQGNPYDYGYDDQGNLATVTAPGMATALVYHYDSDHYFWARTILAAIHSSSTPIIRMAGLRVRPMRWGMSFTMRTM